MCLKQNKFLRCFDRDLNRVQFVLEIRPRAKERLDPKRETERRDICTFVRFGRRNYVIYVCAPPSVLCGDNHRLAPTLVGKCDFHYYDVLIYYNYF